MAKEKQTEISVMTVFDGKQDRQQAFVELILLKHRTDSQEKRVDSGLSETYNHSKVFSDVRVV